MDTSNFTGLLYAIIGAGAGVFFTWLAGRRKGEIDEDTALVKLCADQQKALADVGRELLVAQRGLNAREVHIEDLHRAAGKLPDDARQQFFSYLHTKRPNGHQP